MCVVLEAEFFCGMKTLLSLMGCRLRRVSLFCSFPNDFRVFQTNYKLVGESLFVDGMSWLSRLKETDFDLVIVGFLGWSRKKELSEKYFLFVLERKVLSGNMVQYYFFDELFVCQRNLLVHRKPMLGYPLFCLLQFLVVGFL